MVRAIDVTIRGYSAVKRMETEDILGYQITTEIKAVCLEKIIEWIDLGNRSRYLVCANPHSIHVAQSDQKFYQALKHADLTVPDGAGIVLASRIFSGNIRERITGSDIFFGLCETFNERKKGSCFFLGSTNRVLGEIKRKMAVEYPGIKVVGTYSPPFKTEFSDDDNNKMIAAINDACPDVLWVGMTAPKQEKWIYENRDKLDVRFIAAIGAVFDFYTGRIKRSHPIFQRCGMEWLPRLLQEPRRLWRRNFISSPSFIFRVLSSRLNQK